MLREWCARRATIAAILIDDVVVHRLPTDRRNKAKEAFGEVPSPTAVVWRHLPDSGCPNSFITCLRS